MLGPRRWLGAGAVVVALALTLSGCVPSWLFPRAGQPEKSVPTGELVAPELASYYSQILTWSDCGSGAQCATAVAPMDWEHPANGTDIELALVRHTARNDSHGSLFVNPGGPGGSGFDFVHDQDSLDFAVSDYLQQNFDVVGWDPRGVGRSTPIDCLDDSELDEYLYGVSEFEENSSEWIDEANALAIEFGESCLIETGALLEFVDTDSTARDLDLLRALVGDEKLNYLGYSYGTEIGATYIGAFPEKVGRLVLDGAVDPTLDQFEVVLAQNAAFEQALHAYLDDCADQVDCPFSGHLDRDLTTISELYDELNDEPITAPDGREFTGDVLQTAVFAALYSEETWPYLNDMFAEVSESDTSTGFLLADFYNGRDENGNYADNSYEAFAAIQCIDAGTETDPALIATQIDALIEVAPTFNRPGTLWDPVCANWPFAPSGPLRGPASSVDTAPVLVLSTTGDPATPYAWGVALASQLGNAHLISYTGEGHTAYNKGSLCVNNAVDDYLVDGVVPESDPQC